jgi:SAM-dependent methyltransferase
MNFYKTFFDNLYELEKGKAPGVGSFVWQNLSIPSDVNKILDVGCWRGDFLNSLPDTYDKTGVDICSEPLKNVRGKTYACSIEELPFESESFDLVTCFEVLEHVPYNIFEKSISEIERVSKKYIAVSVPNRQMLKQAFVKCGHCGCLFNPDYHVRSFDSARLKTLFKNFKPISCIECGPLISDYPSAINFLVPVIGVKPKPNTVCPQCGYREGSTGTNNHITDSVSENHSGTSASIGIMSKLKSLIRQNERPYCLLAFFERK